MIKKLASDSFIRHNVVLFLGTMGAAVLNYLYHPILSRLMTVQDFGEVQALLSLYANIVIFQAVFGAVVVNLVANKEEETWDERMKTITALKQITLGVSFLAFFLLVLFSIQLQNFFQFNSLFPFISLACILLISVSNMFRRGYLRGVQRFKQISRLQIFESAARLVFAIVLVLIGWRTFGAITAIVIAQALSLLYVFRLTRNEFVYSNERRSFFSPTIKKELRFSGLILLITLTTSVLGLSDVLIVKHYFDPETAGLYSGISTIARMILFATGSVVGVLIPSVKMKSHHIRNKHLLLKSLSLVLAISIPGLLFFTLFTDFTITVLMGAKFLPFKFLLGPLTLLMILAAVMTTILSYYMSLRQWFAAIFGMTGVAVTLILSLLYHTTITEVITNFYLGVIAVLFLFLCRGVYMFSRHGTAVLWPRPEDGRVG